MSYSEKADALAAAILVLVQGKVDDAFCYRPLVDNLYAFRTGAVNRTGKWDINRIKQNCYRTPAAELASKVEKEHVVPMAEIVNILMAEAVSTVDEVKDVLQKYCVYCMVTPEEHLLLNKQYQRQMPAEFWDEGSIYYLDEWARYKMVGIPTPS